ncbi:MAG: TM0106 family RecB-like putative nuclease, partial [Bdellovibrionales bacterium]|nr:TM0106 family RecB-like putative nuclease [Bdellovibrionales bacterium]
CAISGGTYEEKARRTVEAMRAGVEVVYQATLFEPPWLGHPDFLLRVERPSALGGWCYAPVDTKLAASPKPYFTIQLCFYAELLERVQGVAPREVHIVPRGNELVSYRLEDFRYYYGAVREDFLALVGRVDVDGEPESYPLPCRHCEMCSFAGLCEAKREADDHLVLVAGMRRDQVKKLESCGVRTVLDLARSEATMRPPKLAEATFERLRLQAELQIGKRESGMDQYRVLRRDAPGFGLEALPPPSAGDLFYDIEGDPFVDGGLEYLHGVYYLEDGEERFLELWSHDKTKERESFEELIAFFAERRKVYPDCHIYHYSAYELSALRRLKEGASVHGVAEARLDDLLREEAFCDLYRIVQQGIAVSEPRYSIKNLETFYMPKRSGEVSKAVQSIVWYERWRNEGNDELLTQIRDYNFDDCKSTYLLREWLLERRREAGLAYVKRETGGKKAGKDTAERDRPTADEVLEEYRRRLLPEEPYDPLRELLFHLLSYHRREAKPGWWTYFDRLQMTRDELVEDPECIGGAARDEAFEPEPVKRSLRYRYVYPPQEVKYASRWDALGGAGKELELKDLSVERRSFSLTRGKSSGAPASELDLIPCGPVRDDVVREAVRRFADRILAGDASAVGLAGRRILERAVPAVRGVAPGSVLLPEELGPDERVSELSSVVKRLENSYLCVQGPPGTGKTYAGSKVILELLRDGKRVGVMSNSHKAINNLLEAVEKNAAVDGFRYYGVKRSSSDDQVMTVGATAGGAMAEGGNIRDVRNERQVLDELERVQLLGGTKWVFSREEYEGQFDYLFIDEAGQVALADVLAVSLAARNVLLLGDQMQLAQPTQGAHPGESGCSALEYLLGGEAVIPADRGVFLKDSFRLHPVICEFVSEAVYNGALRFAPETARQRLVGVTGLPEAGIVFREVEHEGCKAYSLEEAEEVRSLYEALVGGSYIDREGAQGDLGTENILVVSPYNMQVQALRDALPEGARVGTVDKFQGQEAEVVIVSLATSSAEDLPRDVSFLYSKNRLNVAVSRARTLAIVVANPALLRIPCRSIEDQRLVNTLCKLQVYSKRSTG